MLYLLGRPAVAVEGQLSPLSLRPKALALLAYLALTGRPVDRHEAARLLFPDAEDQLAMLRWHLTHLRSAAPPFIAERLRATRDDIALPVPTDVTLFRQGANRVCAVPEAPDAPTILALYRADLLAGLAVSAAADFDNWLYVERESLQRRFRQATVAFARWALGHEHAAEALGPLSRLVSVDPYFEEGHVFLIHAYDALGQHGNAATAYERYQRIVRHELSAEPRPSLARRFETNPTPGPMLPREDLVPLREVTIHIVDWPGEEPAILAIHGSAGMAHALGAVAERLAPTSRFVALDLRGHGFSDKPPSGYSLDHHVEDVLQLIDALELRRPVLLGHSAGGTIAAFVATRADVAGLIMLEGMIGDRAFAENAAVQAAPLADALGRSVAGFDAYFKEWLSQQAYTDEAERLLQRWVRYALFPLPDGTYRRRGLRSALEAEWASIIAADSLGALGRVSCPTLIVRGLEPWLGGRPYFTEGIVEAQLRVAQRAELFVARRSNHSTMIRDPEPEMIEAIKRFVHRCRHVAV
jgi:pimeloyl-ACP methyl ester carboxylesterase/DNA-binding SARP family transcriptional activator